MYEKRINPDIETCNLILAGVDTLQRCADAYMHAESQLYYKHALKDVRKSICEILKYAYPDTCIYATEMNNWSSDTLSMKNGGIAKTKVHRSKRQWKKIVKRENKIVQDYIDKTDNSMGDK